MSYSRIIGCFFIFLIGNYTYSGEGKVFPSYFLAQTQLDSIKKLSTKELLNGYRVHLKKNDFEAAGRYAIYYLKRIKKNNNDAQTINAYYAVAYTYKDSRRVIYLDSIAQLARKNSNDSLEILIYNRIGNHFYHNRKLPLALTNYLRAYKLANENNKDIAYSIQHNMGLIKMNLGFYDEALDIFKETSNYYKEANHNEYLNNLHSLANAYIYNNKLDSASIYNANGWRKTYEKKPELHYFFTLNEGINEYYKKNYKASIDSIKKSLSVLKKNYNKDNLAYAYTYLGKALYQLKIKKLAIKYFEKTDSIFQKKGVLSYEGSDIYKYLIAFYKQKGNTEKHLLYRERLSKAENEILNDYKALNKKITKEYDIPILLTKKEKLISLLQNDNKRLSNSTIVLFILLISISVLALYYYDKRKQYKKKFEILFNKPSIKNNTKTLITTKDIEQSIGIADTTVKEILSGLQKFENDKEFLKNTVSLNSLAKKMKTNSNYLSRVINYYEKKTFRSYLSDIRIDYAIEELKSNKQFRKYTVKAIAFEIGFNNSESFATLFYKKTGLYPSYFIKSLNKL